MREELINEIAMYVKTLVPSQDTSVIKMNLEIILKDYEINPRETAVAVRSENINEYAVRKFLVAKTVEGKTDRTIGYYKYVTRTVLDKIDKDVTEITTDDIRYYMAVRKMKDGITDVTMGNEVRVMSTFFAFLQNEEIVKRNPCKPIGPVKAQKQKKEAFSEMDVERIRGACRSKRETAIIELLLSTGCRVKELVGIEKNDAIGDKLVVHGKGKKDRTVYLNAKAQIAVANYLNERSDRNPYLFPKGIWFSGMENRPDGFSHFDWYKNPELITDNQPADIGSIESTVRAIGKRAGVDKCHPHRFRRTCATFALRRGMPIEQVSKMLGHEELTTTQIYLDLSEEELHQAHKKYVI